MLRDWNPRGICHLRNLWIMVKRFNSTTLSSEWQTAFTFVHLVHHYFGLIFEKHKACFLNHCLTCSLQDQHYNWDDGIHRDHRPELRPASSDKSSQAQNYKNQGRFATIKSASLVSLTESLSSFIIIFVLKQYLYCFFSMYYYYYYIITIIFFVLLGFMLIRICRFICFMFY